MQIEAFQSLCVSKQIPFFCYRLPGESEVRMGVQRSFDVLSFANIRSLSCLERRQGFLVAPFDLTFGNKIYFIQSDFNILDEVPSDAIEYIASLPDKKAENGKSCDLTFQYKDDYVRVVTQLIEDIKKGEADKVVYSRIVSQKGLFSKDSLPFVFFKLLEAYPEAYLFWFNIPGVSMWMGASPELFLKKKADEVETVALAGTQLSSEEWSLKNREEQRYVEQFIIETFVRMGLTEIAKSGPYPVRAGSVFHLKTKIFGQMKKPSVWPELLEALHPTPAVCGCPKEKARQMIRCMEVSDRGFYSGFLGSIDGCSNFEFCVNLRSMQLEEDKALLYVGGGITNDSNPEDEWKETELKLMTMGRVLDKIK